MTKFRAIWVTQSAVGCAVAPRTRMRRLMCSMTAKTYSVALARENSSRGYRRIHGELAALGVAQRVHAADTDRKVEALDSVSSVIVSEGGFDH
ncbi:hypothetical protein ACWCQN_23180 [Streptomyces sp. NPDC001984]